MAESRVWPSRRLCWRSPVDRCIAAVHCPSPSPSHRRPRCRPGFIVLQSAPLIPCWRAGQYRAVFWAPLRRLRSSLVMIGLIVPPAANSKSLFARKSAFISALNCVNRCCVSRLGGHYRLEAVLLTVLLLAACRETYNNRTEIKSVLQLKHIQWCHHLARE